MKLLQHSPYFWNNCLQARVACELVPMPKRVLIADDSEVVRRAVQISVEERTGLKVCATTADGPDTIATALRLRPDIVILDVSMPAMNGIEVATILKKRLSSAKIILFTMFAEYVGTKVAQAAGVDIVLDKPEGLSTLLQSLSSML